MKKVIEINNEYIFPNKVWLHFYDNEGFYKGMLIDNSIDMKMMIEDEKDRAIELIISTSLDTTLYKGELSVEKGLHEIIKYFGVDSNFKTNLLTTLNNYKNLMSDEKEIKKVNTLIKDAKRILT